MQYLQGILDKEVVTIDIEVLPNYFLVGILYKEEFTYFESFDKPFEIKSLRDFLTPFVKGKKALLGHNLPKYDLLVLERLLEKKDEISLEECRKISDDIIQDSDDFKYFTRSRWPTVIDTRSFLSQSLKQCAIALNSDDIDEVDVNSKIKKKDVKLLRKYNLADLRNTNRLANHVKDQFPIRKKLGEMIKSRTVWHTSPSTIAGKAIGLNRRDYRLPEEMAINTIASPRKFKNETLIEFQNRLFEKTLPTDSIDDVIEFDGLELQFGRGGLHGFQKQGILQECEDDDYELYDLDFTSFYPNIMLTLKICPIGYAPSEFLEKLQKLTDSRVKAKNNKDKITSDALKLIINSIFGQMGNKHSNFHDPFEMYKVTISGQLILLKLFETLKDHCTHLSLNTDGVLVKIKKENVQEVLKIAKNFGKSINIPIEETKVKKIYAPSINDYIALLDDGTLKLKGRFSDPSRKLTMSKYPEACRNAAIDHVLHGTPIDAFIKKQPLINFLFKRRQNTPISISNHDFAGKTIRYIVQKDKGEKIFCKNKNGTVVNLQPHDRLKTPIFDLKDLPTPDYDLYIETTTTMLTEEKKTVIKSVLTTMISFCNKTTKPDEVTTTRLKTILDRIKKDEKIKKNVQLVRDGKKKKHTLAQVLPQGIFTARRASHRKNFTGFFPIDFDFDDKKENLDSDLEKAKKILFDLPWVVSVFISTSGSGLKGIGLAKEPKDEHSYKSLLKCSHLALKDVLKGFSLSLDESVDCVKGFFISHDPNILVQDNPSCFPYHVMKNDKNDTKCAVQNMTVSKEKLFAKANALKDTPIGERRNKRWGLALISGGFFSSNQIDKNMVAELEQIVITNSDHPEDAKKEWGEGFKKGIENPIYPLIESNVQRGSFRKHLLPMKDAQMHVHELKKGVLKFGYTLIDDVIKINKGDLIIINAESNHGKTTFMVNLMNNFLKQKANCTFIVYEGSEFAIYDKFISLLEMEDKVDPEKLYDTRKQYASFMENVHFKDFPKLLEEGINVIFVDYFQIMAIDSKKQGWEYVKEVASKLQRFCTDTRTIVICASQVNAEGDSREGGDIYISASTVLNFFNHSHDKLRESSKKFIDSKNGNMVISISLRKSKLAKARYFGESFSFDGVLVKQESKNDEN